MPDDKKTQQPQEKSNITDKTKDPKEQNPTKAVESKTESAKETDPEPTLEEDYEALKQMNLLRNVIVRLQYGRYPNKKIDAILKRRMNFDESKFQGTHIVRIIISIMMSFFGCLFLYVIIWLITSYLNLSELRETSSIVISLFFLGSCGFFIFNNISVPDEKKLKEAIKERMAEIEKELKIETKENDNNKTEKQSKTDNNNTK